MIRTTRFGGLRVLLAIAILGSSATWVYGQDAAKMTTFMKDLTPQYVSGIAGKDPELQKMLLQTFEADWLKAKECLLFDRWPVPGVKTPSHGDGLALMAELVRMRGKVCDGVAKETQANIVQYLQAKPDTTAIFKQGMGDFFKTEVNGGTLESHFRPLPPTGAQKLTSDIDVASGGLNTEFGVRLFNETFRKKLDVDWDPATVFDYNVYAADWIFLDNFKKEPTGGGTLLTPGPEHVLAKDAGPSAAPLDDQLQKDRAAIFDKAGLLHIRRNCTQQEWDDYSRRRAPEGALVVTRLQEVNGQFGSFNAEIKQKVKDLKSTIKPRTSAWLAPSYFEEAVETRARNQIYQDRLLTVKALRLHYRMLKEKAAKTDDDRTTMCTLAGQITEALTDAIFFANEVYATEGATLHATQGIQAVAKARLKGETLVVRLTTAQYVQSFQENVGDSLHSLSHYESDPPYAAYRAGKYIERMLLAGESLDNSTLKSHESYTGLRALGEKAATTKASDDGDDPAKIAQLFKEYSKKEDLTPLRQAILKMGGDVAGKIGS